MNQKPWHHLCIVVMFLSVLSPEVTIKLGFGLNAQVVSYS